MTVSDAVIATYPGGTFSESSLAQPGPAIRELRRPQPGAQRRAAAGRDAGGQARPGGAGERSAAPRRADRSGPARPEGSHAGARHGRGRLAHRPRRRAALGWHVTRAAAPGDGALDAGDV